MDLHLRLQSNMENYQILMSIILLVKVPIIQEDRYKICVQLIPMLPNCCQDLFSPQSQNPKPQGGSGGTKADLFCPMQNVS